MPKLKILAVCEKVILDQQQVPSLIGIFERMNIEVQDAPLPENAIAPVRWSVFTLWQHTSEEKNVEYTQKTRIVGPDGKLFSEVGAKFTLEKPDEFQSKNQIELLGLPISTEGNVLVEVHLEGIPGSEARYEFAIVHVQKERNVQTGPSTVQ